MVLAMGLTSAVAKADIGNFDYSNNTWDYVNGDNGSAIMFLGNSHGIHLTNGVSSSASEWRSTFFKTPQSTSHFTASFDYLATNMVNSSEIAGFAFVLQGDPRQSLAVGGSGTSARFLGYNGIQNSTAVEFDLYNSSFASSSSSTGLFSNGTVGNPASNSLGTDVVLTSGHTMHIVIDYTNFQIREEITDTSNGKFIDLGPFGLPLGGSPAGSLPTTAYVGITASTNAGVDQLFTNFNYSTSVPEPSSIILLGVGAAAFAAFARRRRCV
jgi:hypothetical protein